MASGRINRNVPDPRGIEGVLAETTPLLASSAGDVTLDTIRPANRPDRTELSGLISDPICTADRRGGILISSGRKRTRAGQLNPSKLGASTVQRWRIDPRPAIAF